MRLYYYTSEIHGLSAIKSKRLKISRFKDLNDPFELEALLSGDSVDNYRKLVEYKERLSRVFGLICLSSTSTEMLMWSHYAKHHTGMVLGFETEALSAKDWETIDRMDVSLLEQPIQVSYTASRIVRKESFSNIDNALIAALLLTKSQSWAYENEYRVLVPLRGITSSLVQSDDGKLLFLNFESHLILKEVLLGARCVFKPFKIDTVLREAGFSDVTVSEMILAPETFEIVRRKPDF